MGELARSSLAEQLGAPLLAPGLAVCLLDPAGQWLVSGATPPPNTIAGDDPYTLWLAPNRALVVARAPAPAPVGELVSEVTDGFALFTLSGPRALDVLAMASSLDPALLAPGRCAQTLLAGMKVILSRHGEVLHLHVERTLAAHLMAWLRQAVTALGEVA